MVENLVSLKMISYKKACNYIKTNTSTSTKDQIIEIEDSCERIISKDYRSNYCMPFTNLSAMDGIVVNERSLTKKKKYEIVGESKSGDKSVPDFKDYQCILIFTGAPLPKGKKVVIPKENCEYSCDKKSITINQIPKQKFVRFKGSDIKKNELVLKSGSVMSLRKLALAKSLRINKVKVLKKPRIFVISTGDELLKKNLIVPTNHILVEFLSKKFGAEVIGVDIINDDSKKLINKIKRLEKFDLLITTGGISEGKYDIVKNSLQKMNIKVIFDKVLIKPGKPTTFGKFTDKQLFLGLPGNPVSCFMSMINFFPIFINKFYGTNIARINHQILRSRSFISKNGRLTTFQRIKCVGNEFEIFDSQDSSMQNILSKSDGIIMRNSYAKPIKKNEYVKILTFNNIIENYI